jgi:3-methylfumaryl-CoA hydratase
MDHEDLKQWIGRTEMANDLATVGPLLGLGALLDHEESPWPSGVVPPLGHWLYFLPRERQSRIDVDGHARRGTFLPPVDLPRRMWAGGRLDFIRPVQIGAALTRKSVISAITPKSGATGPLVFVTVRHEISANGVPAILEEQDIVYRGAATARPEIARPAEPQRADAERLFTPDATRLFRFSALTFNAHRIHYDRDYARNVEGYGGLVVHGPFIAVLLLDLLRRHRSGTVRRFAFRAQRPTLDLQTFSLCLSGDESAVNLWSRDADGHTTLSASAKLE